MMRQIELQGRDRYGDKGEVIDITAVMLNHAEKYVRWHLYDVKA